MLGSFTEKLFKQRMLVSHTFQFLCIGSICAKAKYIYEINNEC